MAEVRIRSSEPRDANARSVRRRAIEMLLGPVFGVLLVVPIIRRERRKARWKWVRLSGWAAGVALLAVGWGHAWAEGAGAALFLAATILRKIEDPERVQKAAEKLGARHVVNAGVFAGGDLELRMETRLLFFVTPTELLATRAAAPEQVIWRCPLAWIEAIQVAGEDFQPHYVSFAKAPPVRDENADPDARCRLALRVSEPGERQNNQQNNQRKLELEYRGVFARHLAEIGAHTIYNCRALARQTPAERLPVIG